jgi:hypothetical protein
MPGVRLTRSLACKKKARKQVTTGSPKHSGIPCAMVLTVSFVVSPAIGFVATVAGRSCCRLDVGIETSGRHDFAVRLWRARLSRQKRPPHLLSNVRDDRETSLVSVRRRAEKCP